MSAIHPNPGGPTHAASPYYRKLAEVSRALHGLIAVAREEDKADLTLALGILDKLFEQRG